MIDASSILAIAESHFTRHLLAPGEADVAPASDETTEGAAGATESVETNPALLPENLVEDFIDEVLNMSDEISELYEEHAGWERALVFGFIDGVLAAANDTWSDYEDSYFENADNADFEAIDETINEIAADFDGSRPWDEAAKGYIRKAIERAGADPVASSQPLWTACTHAFIYGLEAAYDLEWKVIVTPAGNLMLTDEDAISEAALAKLSMETGSGSLIDRIFDMVGIDLDALADAIGEVEDLDEGADGATPGDGESAVEGELLQVEDIE